VCDDAATFEPKLRAVVDDAVRRGFFAWSDAHRARWRLVDGFVGPGYAQTTPETLRAMRELARTEGIIVDPVYTGKAFSALPALGPPTDGVTVFLHTGGIFELFAHAEAIDAL
jgi:D-cysteine desulfhydrase